MEHWKNTVKAGVIGHAVGDALGVPVEFTDREMLKHMPVTGMLAFGSHRMPAGTWSDDTSMELCLMQSLIDKGQFDYDSIMDNFYKWSMKDEFTATGYCFDIGITCSSAILKYRDGTPALECGGTGERSNGNGSLMRILPVAFVCHKNNISGKQRYELTKNVSSLTHANEVSVLGCYIYVNYICHLLDGDDKNAAYKATQSDDYSMFSKESLAKYARILEANIAELDESEIASGGYVVSSLEASLWCTLTTTSYKEAVLQAVNLGRDTDTIGAITGSIAGIVYGYEAIPQEWSEKLQRRDYLVKICDDFAETEIAC